jgi:hypothetical protein
VAEHVIDATRVHHHWDNALEPTLRIASGDVVHYDLAMAGRGQVERTSRFEDTRFDFDTLYNLLGPVFVEGAEPGDTLEIEVLSLTPGDWGWCVILPELGLLAEDFPDPYLKIFDLEGRRPRRARPRRLDPDRAVPRHDGHPPRRATDAAALPAEQGRRQRGHPPPETGCDAVAAGLVRRRALLLRRSARRPRRRRGLRRMPTRCAASPATSRSSRSSTPGSGTSGSRCRSRSSTTPGGGRR